MAEAKFEELSKLHQEYREILENYLDEIESIDNSNPGSVSEPMILFGFETENSPDLKPLNQKIEHKKNFEKSKHYYASQVLIKMKENFQQLGKLVYHEKLSSNKDISKQFKSIGIILNEINSRFLSFDPEKINSMPSTPVRSRKTSLSEPKSKTCVIC